MMKALRKSSSLPVTSKNYEFGRLTVANDNDNGESSSTSSFLLSLSGFTFTSSFNPSFNQQCWSFSELHETNPFLYKSQSSTQTDHLFKAIAGPSLPSLNFLTAQSKVNRGSQLKKCKPIIPTASPPPLLLPPPEHFTLTNNKNQKMRTSSSLRSSPHLTNEIRGELVQRIGQCVDKLLKNTHCSRALAEFIIKHDICHSLKELFKDGLVQWCYLHGDKCNHHHQPLVCLLQEIEGIRNADEWIEHDCCSHTTDYTCTFFFELIRKQQLARWISGRMLANHTILQRSYSTAAFLRSTTTAYLRRSMLTALAKLYRFSIVLVKNNKNKR